MRRVEFFYDIVSPYSWFAFETLCRYKERWNLDLVLRPFFLSGVMQATDNKPAGFFPAKLPYVQKDLIRSAEYFQVPLSPPSEAVTLTTIRPMRLLISVSKEIPDSLFALTRSLWEKHWRDGKDTSQDAVLSEAMSAASISELQVGALLRRIEESAIKRSLREATDEAVARGAFGAPTLFVDTTQGEEMFFGSDRFPLVARCLGVEWLGPVPENLRL